MSRCEHGRKLEYCQVCMLALERKAWESMIGRYVPLQQVVARIRDRKVWNKRHANRCLTEAGQMFKDANPDCRLTGSQIGTVALWACRDA